MENASKALIIAGAILLSILIITLGIFIYQQASGVVKNNSMNQFEIQTFNEKFTQSEGTNVRGPEVNTLLNRIIQNNVANQDDTSKQVKVKVTAEQWIGTKPNSVAITVSSDAGKAQSGKTYTVTCKTDGKTGLVNEVDIENPTQ